MKTKLFLAAGLLISAFGFGQTYYEPAGSAGSGGIFGVHIGYFSGSLDTGTANTFVGYQSGNKNTSGSRNTFLGHEAGVENSTGISNVAVGHGAGQFGNSSYNVFIGTASGRYSSGNFNTLVGAHAGHNLTGTNIVAIGANSGFYATGSNSVAIGTSAGTKAGSRNVYIGDEAGIIAEEQDNVFVGHSSGKENKYGSRNIFIGGEAGLSSETSNYNIFLGFRAGKLNNSSSNVFIGTTSGLNNTSVSNVFVGHESGMYSEGGNRNSYFGVSSGAKSTGNKNTFLGFFAGENATGDSNVCLGANAGDTASGNELYIDNSATPNPLIYGDFEEEHLMFNTNKVGIGTTFNAGDFTTNLPNDSMYRLYVKGGILAEEVRVRLQGDWADYVFSKDYNLLSLKETEQYIKENGHLPNMPSAEEVEKDGLEMGSIIKLQQEKIEELTLHLIEQGKEIELLKERNKQIDELKAQVQLLLNRQ